MNVLSLFDGISCGMLALDKLGINIDNYLDPNWVFNFTEKDIQIKENKNTIVDKNVQKITQFYIVSCGKLCGNCGKHCKIELF